MVWGLLAMLVVGVPSAGAAITGTQLTPPITVTGTEGKDDIEIRFRQLTTTSGVMTVTPAVTITAASGSCPPNTDPLTGRPTYSECRFGDQASGTGLIVNLNGGDDSLEVDDTGFMSQYRLNGGPGNDTIRAQGIFDRVLKGDDGDDLLVAIGGLSTDGRETVRRPVTFDGGAGIDTAGWEDLVAPATEERLGVTASLATGVATISGRDQALIPTTFRTDTLTTVENLNGSEMGDILTGSSGPNTLIGGGGNDNLRGGDGDDNLQGGDDLDDLVGGKGRNTLDGGLGIDTFPKGTGGDTFLMRDGYAEVVSCVDQDVIIDDLVDKIATDPLKCSVSTAAAKHLYDTKLSGRAAKIGAGGALVTKISCPALKTEACQGELEAVLGKKVLARGEYKVAQGTKEKVRLPLSRVNTDRAAGKRIVLEAKEVDADGRDRFVSRPTRVEKARSQPTATS
jgi:hypothetical protein